MSFGGKPSTPSPKSKPKVDVKSETKPKPRLASSISSSVGDKSQRAKDVAVQETESSPRSPIGSKTPPAQKSPSGPVSPSKGLVADNSPSSLKRRTRSSLGVAEDTARGLEFSTSSPKADEKKQVSKVDDKKVTRLDDKKQPVKTDMKKQPIKTEERKPFVTGKADSWSPTIKTPPVKPTEKPSPVSAEKKPRNAPPLSTTPKGKAGMENVNVGSRGLANSQGPISKASNLASINTAAKSPDGPAVVSSSPRSDSGKRSSVVEDDIWICRECGWTYPNAHPSAKHRRNHKKHCAEIKAKKAEGLHVRGGSSDEASSDDEGPAESGTVVDIVATPVEGLISIAEARDSSEVEAIGGPIGKDEAIPSSGHETPRQAFTDEVSNEQHVKAAVMNGKTALAEESILSSDHETGRQEVNEAGSDKQHVYELSPGSPSVKARVEELERKCSNLGDSGHGSLGNYGSPSKKFSILRDSPHSSPVKKLLLPEASTLFLDRLQSEFHDGTGHHFKLTPSSAGSEHEVVCSELSEPASPVKTENRGPTAVQASAEELDGAISRISQSASGGSESIHSEGFADPFDEKYIHANQELLPQNSLGLHTVGDVKAEDVFVDVSDGATSKLSSNGTGGNEGNRSESLKLDHQDEELNVAEAEHCAAPFDGGYVSGKQDLLPPDSEVLRTVHRLEEQPTAHTALLATPLLHYGGEPGQLKPKDDSASICDHATGLSVENVEVAEQLPHTTVLPPVPLDAPQCSQSETHVLLSTEDADGNAEDGEQGRSMSYDTPTGTEEAVKSDGEVLYHPFGYASASTVEEQVKSHEDFQSVGIQNVGSDGEIIRDVAVDVKDGAPSGIPAASEMLLGLKDCSSGSLPAEPGDLVAAEPGDLVAAEVLDRTRMSASLVRAPDSVDVNETEDPFEVEVATESTEDEVSAVRTPFAPVNAPNLGDGETSQVNLASVVTEGVPAKADLLVGVASVECGGAGDPQASVKDSGRIDGPIVNAEEASGAGGVVEVQSSALDDKSEVLDSLPPGDSEISNKAEAVSSILHDSTTSELVLTEPENLVEAHPAFALESLEVSSRRVTFADDAKTVGGHGATHDADASELQSGVSDDASPVAEIVQSQEVITHTPVQYTSTLGQNCERLEDSSQIVTDGGFPEREDRSSSNHSVVQVPSEVPDEGVVDRHEPTAHHEAAELPKELEDQYAVIGLAKKVEPALSTASAVAIPRSGRESREKELWERLLDHDVKQNATSPTHFFSSEETWQPEFEEKLLQNSALLNADALDEKSPSESQESQITSAGTHLSGVLEAERQVDADPDSGSSEVEAGIQAGEISSKAAPRDTEHEAGDAVLEQSISAQQKYQGEFENGLSLHVHEVLPVVQGDQTEEASQEERSEPTLKASGHQIQSDVSLPKQGASPIAVDADVTESSSKSEVSMDNGVKAVEKQHHRLKNLLEEEHQAERPVTPATETKASPSPRTSPFLKRFIERVRSSPPNVAIPKDVSKEESSESEVAAARRSIFSCQCFSPVKSN